MKKNKLTKLKIRSTKKESKGKQQKKKTKSNNPIDSDDEKEIYFDTDSEPDSLMRQEAPDSKDAECMFCNNLFSQDTREETWLKCLICGLWDNGDCAGAEFDTWICDFCK
ncbi:hypothetical protein HHI36_004365 [Cryptolaemus montrouzieri]|uniref:Uncharacterized protein n=1 Tax=Cryptolaemus montrouzieri TaxID=559131 RepID=A0ABD2NR00_9CUCU